MKVTAILIVLLFGFSAFAQNRPPTPPPAPKPPQTEEVQPKDSSLTLQLVQAIAHANEVNSEIQEYTKTPEYQKVAAKLDEYRKQGMERTQAAQSLQSKIKKAEGWGEGYYFDPQKMEWMHIVGVRPAAATATSK